MQRQTPTGDEPKFSSKLKRIIGRAKRYLRRRKVAGIVIVYEPGFSEYLAMIDPPRLTMPVTRLAVSGT